jgi:hypothetical protein
MWRNVVVTEVEWGERRVRYRFCDRSEIIEFNMSRMDIEANWDKAHLKMAMDRHVSELFTGTIRDNGVLTLSSLPKYEEYSKEITDYVKDMFSHPYEMQDYLYRSPRKELIVK